MEKEEILKRAKAAHPVGEMEKNKINASCWIALIATAIVAIIMIILEGTVAKEHCAIFAIAGICFVWAGIFYFCQYFIAKRHYVGILIGAILESSAAIAMFVLYGLFVSGILA